MARSSGAAGMVLAGLGGGDSRSTEGAIDFLVDAGVRAFLFPGSLLAEAARLSSLASYARRRAEMAGLGRILIAIGGAALPGFGQPFFPSAVTPLGLAAIVPPRLGRQAAKRAGRLLGLALAAAGIDMVLAPRLDLASDPKDPSGALDRFGEDPDTAGSLAAEYIRGLDSAGVAACAGRFPGLGSVCVERSTGLTFVGFPAERLEAVEMRPFGRAARAGAAAVLVGRILVPSLEPERIPATQSARIIEGRLREALGFKGFVIGDDICPEAEPLKAVLLGALAGCDLCLVSDPETARAAAAELERAAAVGELPAPRIAVAMRRLERFLANRPVSLERQHGTPARLEEAELRRAERDREESLTALKGELAMARGKSLVLAFLPPRGSPEAAEIPAARDALRAVMPDVDILFLPADPTPLDTRALSDRLSGGAIEGGGPYVQAAALTYDAHFRPAQEGLARLVEESVSEFRVVAMRDPYDAAFFPRARGLGAAYGFTAAGMGAVARLLTGGGEPKGLCPVQVIGLEV
jgi:beta-glucosidase-like glycosyl hydrolase